MTTHVFVYPTETAYAIGCDARDTVAVEKIFAMKGRAPEKTVPLIAASAAMVAHYVDAAIWQQPQIQEVVAKYWPGALTLVLPINDTARQTLAPQVIYEDTIAVRVSTHPLARALSQEVGAPIVSTSANASGSPSCYTVAAVRASLAHAAEQPDDYFDDGELPQRASSTIAKFENGAWEIIRQGEIHIC